MINRSLILDSIAIALLDCEATTAACEAAGAKRSG